MRSPLDDLGEELGDQVLIVRLDLLNIDRLVTLAVEVVRIECPHCLQRTLVVGVGQMLISILTMPAASSLAMLSRFISE